jgi:hypothetical protein
MPLKEELRIFHYVLSSWYTIKNQVLWTRSILPVCLLLHSVFSQGTN